MKRHRVSWSGTPVTGPGLSTFYEAPSSAVGGADDIQAFFEAIKAYVPTGVQWTIPSNGDLIESTTGALAGSWSDPGTGGTVTATGLGQFANGVGTRIVWNTDGLFHDRRVKGSTFIVPLVVSAYEGAGNITSGALAALQAAADGLVAAMPDMKIWSNPRGGVDGEVSQVLSATVPDRVSWLRSRRT